MSRLSLGTKAKIIANNSNHNFRLGTIVYKVYSDHPRCRDLWSKDRFLVARTNGGDGWWIYDSVQELDLLILETSTNYEIC